MEYSLCYRARAPTTTLNSALTDNVPAAVLLFWQNCGGLFFRQSLEQQTELNNGLVFYILPDHTFAIRKMQKCSGVKKIYSLRS